MIEETARVRAQFSAAVSAAGLSPPPSHTNFVLIPFASRAAADRADRALRDGGYLLRKMGGYGLGHCLRATIGAPGDMARVAEILAAQSR